MAGVYAAGIAVLGTLLGSIVTYIFQRRGAERAAALAFVERLRQERLDSYSGFAGVLIRYRLAEIDRWHRGNEQPDGDDHQRAKEATYRMRTEAYDALFRVQLLTGDHALRTAAGEAMEATSEIHRTTGKEEQERQAMRARAAINRFVELAAAHLRPVGAVAAMVEELD